MKLYELKDRDLRLLVTYFYSNTVDPKNILEGLKRSKSYLDKVKDINKVSEVIKIIAENSIPESELLKIYNHLKIDRLNNLGYHISSRVYIERRDNKKIINSKGDIPSGSSSSIRYPSKKRSRNTWKRFYDLFPHLAEKDEWNGRTSKRYK